MEVTVYSTPTCGMCKMFKNRLAEKNIPFVDVQDEEKVLNLAQNAGINTVPIIEIDGQLFKIQEASKKLGL